MEIKHKRQGLWANPCPICSFVCFSTQICFYLTVCLGSLSYWKIKPIKWYCMVDLMILFLFWKEPQTIGWNASTMFYMKLTEISSISLENGFLFFFFITNETEDVCRHWYGLDQNFKVWIQHSKSVTYLILTPCFTFLRMTSSWLLRKRNSSCTYFPFSLQSIKQWMVMQDFYIKKRIMQKYKQSLANAPTSFIYTTVIIAI